MPSKSKFCRIIYRERRRLLFCVSYDVDDSTAENKQLSQQALHALDATYECCSYREC
jgi:hypothetical protein